MTEMTDDLVKRLRESAEDWDDIGVHANGKQDREAADRIEELEKALREKDNIAYIIDEHGITHLTFTIVYKDKSDD